ncbi:MAG: FUSC family protein [Terrisporobacter sp.]|uniref:FUSC family protein n=2 Tax=Clostridia TaxID=186801 RepID=UPI002FC5C2CF
MSKVFLFVFCVLFISIYKKFFGSDNSIVGVILLMGTLMFIGNDFGYDTKYASILIPITFVGVGVFAKLSLINPFIGLIINLVVIQCILMVGRGDKNASAYLPFMMGYIMFKGYDVSGDLFTKRLISLAVVGGFIGLIYFVVNKNKTFDKPYKEKFQNFLCNKSYKRWNLIYLVTLTFAIFVGDILHIEKSMWINLTVSSLIPPMKESIRERKSARIPATIFGSIICFTLFGYVIPESYQPTVMMMGGLFSMFLTTYFVKTTYNSFAALATASLIMPIHKAVFLRIIANITGVIITIGSMFIFEKVFNNADDKEESLSRESLSSI